MSEKNLALYILCLLFIFDSCRSNEGYNQKAFNLEYDSLNSTSKILQSENEILYQLLKKELTNEQNFQKAVVWFPRAEVLRYTAEEISEYLNKVIIKIKADSANINQDSLYQKLQYFLSKAMSIDSRITNVSHKYFLRIANSIVPLNPHDATDNIHNFASKTKQEKLYTLSKVTSEIKTLENKILQFCLNSTVGK